MLVEFLRVQVIANEGERSEEEQCHACGERQLDARAHSISPFEEPSRPFATFMPHQHPLLRRQSIPLVIARHCAKQWRVQPVSSQGGSWETRTTLRTASPFGLS